MRSLLLLIAASLLLVGESARAASVCTTADACQKACDAGKLDACIELGRRHETGDGVFRDEAVLQQVLGKACEKGERSACVSLASVLLDEKGGWQKPLNALRAVALLQDACTARHAPACELFARALLRGKGLETDRPRAVLLFQSACDAGQLSACAEVGLALINGAGVARDRERGIRLIEETCAKNGAAACRTRAELREKGLDGSPADPAAGLQLLEQACELGDGLACEQLAKRFYRGTGVNVDQARAVKLYERSCSLGWPSACAGQSLGLDAGASLRLALVACQSGLKLYCQPLLYVPPGLSDLAYDVMERSCRLGNNQHCQRLGRDLLAGHRGEPERARARRFFADACEAGRPSGCENLADAWLLDPGADAAKADRLLAAFCTRGRAEACAARERVTAQLQAEASTTRCQKKNDLAACADAGQYLYAKGQENEGFKLLRKACDGKVWSACHHLAFYTLMDATMDPQMSWEALELFDKACKGGFIPSCVEQAAEEMTRDPAQGRKLYEAACAKEASACDGLIDELLSGRSLKQDIAGGLALLDEACARSGGKSICDLEPRYKWARELHADQLACEAGDGGRCFAASGKAARDSRPALIERGCQLGHPEACLKAGELVLDQTGAQAYDAARAAGHFARACEGGVNKACHQQGLLLLGGRGAALDHAGSRAALEKACAGQPSLGCVELADLLRDGAGGPSDAPRAASLLETACRAGQKPACLSAAELWRDGSAGPRDDVKARALLSLGCASGTGDKLACEFEKAISQTPGGGR